MVMITMAAAAIVWKSIISVREPPWSAGQDRPWPAGQDRQGYGFLDAG